MPLKFLSALASTAAIVLCVPAVHADVPVDTVGTVVLQPSNGHRLYVSDLAPSHSVDSKVHVIDGDTFKLLGNVHNGQWGFFQLSKDGKTLYSASSFFSRGDHGERTEVLEFYDPATLAPASELVIPKSRASTFNYPVYMTESASSRYLLIQNATPASSVTVIDLPARKVLAELQTTGCFGIYPAQKEDGRFSTLCGDGAVVTVGFDGTGHETARKRSARLFDPDKDALFIYGIPDGRNYIFMSFLGNVHLLDLSGEVATQQKPWPLITGKAIEEGWRPGGYQLMAYNKVNGQLYVGMHANGKEGSHKNLAEEIWKIDLAKRAVLTRAPGTLASYITVTQELRPLVFTLSPATNLLSRLDGNTLQVLGQSPKDWTLLESGGPLIVN